MGFIKKKENSHAAASVKVGAKGQIVIPKEMRDMFDIKPDDTLILLADKKRGIAINTYDKLGKVFEAVMSGNKITIEENSEDDEDEYPEGK